MKKNEANKFYFMSQILGDSNLKTKTHSIEHIFINETIVAIWRGVGTPHQVLNIPPHLQSAYSENIK